MVYTLIDMAGFFYKKIESKEKIGEGDILVLGSSNFVVREQPSNNHLVIEQLGKVVEVVGID